MSELPHQRLKLNPGTQWRKLISATCIYNLILLVLLNAHDHSFKLCPLALLPFQHNSLIQCLKYHRCHINLFHVPFSFKIVSKTPRYLSSLTWGSNSQPKEDHFFLVAERNMAPDLKVVTLILTLSHLVANTL